MENFDVGESRNSGYILMDSREKYGKTVKDVKNLFVQ